PPCQETTPAVPRASPRGGRAGRPDRGGIHRLWRTTAPVTPLEATARTDSSLPPRRERVSEPSRHPLALALPPGPSVRLPRRRPGASCVLSARGVRHGDVRRELELARAGLDARQSSHRPRAPEPLCLLWRRLHRGVP